MLFSAGCLLSYFITLVVDVITIRFIDLIVYIYAFTISELEDCWTVWISTTKFLCFFLLGTANRTVASTQMNATSSRAHTVVTIQFDQIEKNAAGEETKKSSVINLVDLAGQFSHSLHHCQEKHTPSQSLFC